MASRYRQVLAVPGTAAFTLAALAARMAHLLGFTIAPVLITGFSIAGLLVPEGQVTEGLTWVTSAMGSGIAIGSAAAGQLADG
jgi:hypothetical protein